jgi:hypothetical protein
MPKVGDEQIGEGGRNNCQPCNRNADKPIIALHGIRDMPVGNSNVRFREIALKKSSVALADVR